MYRKVKELCTRHNGGRKKIASNCAKTFQMTSAFVLTLYYDVTSTTQL
jgi:hypothetical protein